MREHLYNRRLPSLPLILRSSHQLVKHLQVCNLNYDNFYISSGANVRSRQTG